MYDKLIKELREYWNDGTEDIRNEAADAIEDLWQALDTAQGVLAEQPSTWIPVTEQLPKENGFYLCLYKHKASGGVAMDEGLSILRWINNKWGINDIYLVTHWMPIPQPPEDGET